MSHTPGPWRLRLKDDECGDYFIIEMADARRSSWQPQHRIEYPEGGTVRESHPEQFAEAQANALLIAAAPELLAALIAVVDNIELLDNPSDQGISAHSDTVENCRVAIAKAEGHS